MAVEERTYDPDDQARAIIKANETGVSSAEEFHPRALAEPDVSLSTHTASIISLAVCTTPVSHFVTGSSRVGSWPVAKCPMIRPLRSRPVTGPSTLLRVDPSLCIVCRYSGPCDRLAWTALLASGTDREFDLRRGAVMRPPEGSGGSEGREGRGGVRFFEVGPHPIVLQPTIGQTNATNSAGHSPAWSPHARYRQNSFLVGTFH